MFQSQLKSDFFLSLFTVEIYDHMEETKALWDKTKKKKKERARAKKRDFFFLIFFIIFHFQQLQLVPTGQPVPQTDYFCHNNETGLCATELSFNKNTAAVQGMHWSPLSPGSQSERGDEWEPLEEGRAAAHHWETDTLPYSTAVAMV